VSDDGDYQDVVCVGCGWRDRRLVPKGLTGWIREFACSREHLCETCWATGRRDEAQIAEQREREAAHRETQHRIRISGIPDPLRTASLVDLDLHQPIDDARRWARRELAGLLLTGSVGAGKTHTAAAAAVAALQTRKVIWCSVPTLLAHLSMEHKAEQHLAALNALTGTGALVLDDLDKARPTDYGAERIFAAIDSRTAAGAQLLVTTNLELSEIATRYPQPYGEAIASRLAGYCTWHHIDHPDRRTGAVA
jgi:DNA replication protein DnaC